MNNILLILQLDLGKYSEARSISPNQAEVSKVDYPSKANSCNVRNFVIPKRTVLLVYFDE